MDGDHQDRSPNGHLSRHCCRLIFLGVEAATTLKPDTCSLVTYRPASPFKLGPMQFLKRFILKIRARFLLSNSMENCIMHICRNRTILRSCPRWKVILRTWETNGWLWLQVAGSGWIHLVNFILHFWDILPSCLIIALPSVWVASYLEGYSKAPLFNLKWQFCPVCAPLAELMRIVNYAIC